MSKYRIMKYDLRTDLMAYQEAVHKAINRTWRDALLGRNKWPKLEYYDNPITEVVKIVDTEDEAKMIVWLAEPWCNQTGGRFWYEEIKD